MNDSPSKHDAVRHLAQSMAVGNGLDPNMLVSPGVAAVVQTPVGVQSIVNLAMARPVWACFVHAATAALDVVSR